MSLPDKELNSGFINSGTDSSSQLSITTDDPNDPNNLQCRICLETLIIKNKQDYVKPCLCNSQVHRVCLEKWLQNKPSNNMSKLQCEVCHYKFKMEQKYDYMTCIGHSFRFVIYWIINMILMIISATVPLIMFLGYTWTDLIDDNIKFNTGESASIPIWSCMSILFIVLMILTSSVFCIYNSDCKCNMNGQIDPCDMVKAPFCQSTSLYILLIISEVIAFSIVHLTGLGVYNLFVYDDVLYEFYPRFRTFWVGVITILVFVIVIGSCIYIAVATPHIYKSTLNMYAKPNRIANV
jgi:hypothetical protein